MKIPGNAVRRAVHGTENAIRIFSITAEFSVAVSFANTPLIRKRHTSVEQLLLVDEKTS
jgi:hypothetical protein